MTKTLAANAKLEAEFKARTTENRTAMYEQLNAYNSEIKASDNLTTEDIIDLCDMFAELEPDIRSKVKLEERFDD
jgi:hypothetical protein